MKRIYLDWGVVSNLKKPEFTEVKKFLLSKKGELFFVYSTAHFEDAMRSKGDERLLQDIQTLESLVGNHLLMYNKNNAYPFLLTPSEYYQSNKDRNLDEVPDIAEMLSSIDQDVPMLGGLLKSFLSFPIPIPDATREQPLFSMMLPGLPDSSTLGDILRSSMTFVNKMLGDREYYKAFRSSIRANGFTLDPNSGNWAADEVLPNISARMKALGIDKTFEEFVLSGFGKRDKVSNYEFFIASYGMLDMIGYKSDKLPKASNAMNSVSTDAQHAYFAAFCDYLITQDTHLASKARALYAMLGISTKVISPGDAIEELNEERNDDLIAFLSDQLKEDNIERKDERSVVYKFGQRFLGIFTHCVKYEEDDCIILEFKLAFDNYSFFIFYEESGIMIDTITDYLGRPSRCDYAEIRQLIIDGNPNAAIRWDGDNVTFILRSDPERHRPELFVTVPLTIYSSPEKS